LTILLRNLLNIVNIRLLRRLTFNLRRVNNLCFNSFILYSFFKSILRNIFIVFILIYLRYILHSFFVSILREIIDVFVLEHLWHILSLIFNHLIVCNPLLSRDIFS
jgi:hypothetical protein